MRKQIGLKKFLRAEYQHIR